MDDQAMCCCEWEKPVGPKKVGANFVLERVRRVFPNADVIDRYCPHPGPTLCFQEYVICVYRRGERFMNMIRFIEYTTEADVSDIILHELLHMVERMYGYWPKEDKEQEC